MLHFYNSDLRTRKGVTVNKLYTTCTVHIVIIIIILLDYNCMIGCIYIWVIAPLTMYLGRSFSRHVRCLSVTCSLFFRFYRDKPERRILLRCVRSTEEFSNFESSPDRSSFVIRFLLSCTRIQGI